MANAFTTMSSSDTASKKADSAGSASRTVAVQPSSTMLLSVSASLVASSRRTLRPFSSAVVTMYWRPFLTACTNTRFTSGGAASYSCDGTWKQKRLRFSKLTLMLRPVAFAVAAPCAQGCVSVYKQHSNVARKRGHGRVSPHMLLNSLCYRTEALTRCAGSLHSQQG